MKKWLLFFLCQQQQINQGEGKDQSYLLFSEFPGLEIECNSETLFAVCAVYTITRGARKWESTN